MIYLQAPSVLEWVLMGATLLLVVLYVVYTIKKAKKKNKEKTLLEKERDQEDE